MKNYAPYLSSAPAALLGVALLFASCKEEERSKSSACDVLLFSVDALTWEVEGANITRHYPPETPAEPLAPTISLSPGATVDPPSGQPQNFFTAGGVAYTVTAEDGATKKTYTARATRTPYAGGEILSFAAGGVAWSISDSLVTCVYPADAAEGLLTPSIAISPGAAISPPASQPQNFFAGEGVRYTVTSEDGATAKTYLARARRVSSACDILSFVLEGAAWSISGTDITYTYDYATTETLLTPTISLSPGATVSPPASEPQNFFAGEGVTYTVRAEDSVATKTYTAKATARYTLAKYPTRDWVVLPRYGSHSWYDGTGEQNLWDGGHPMLILDDDLASGWHSPTSDTAAFPHLLVIDMKATKSVAKVLGSGLYLKNVQVYLTNSLPFPGYESWDVWWDDEAWRKIDYEYMEQQIAAKIPGSLPLSSWGAPIAQTANADNGTSFSFLLPQPQKGRYLMLLFPSNSNPPSTQIAIYNLEVYHN